MLMAAGHPEAKDGQWSDNMIDDVVFWGDETKVAERIQELFSFGATEVLASPFARRAGPGGVLGPDDASVGPGSNCR